MPCSAARREDEASKHRVSPDSGSVASEGSLAMCGVSRELRSFHHAQYPPERIAAARAERGLSVSVCLPARECAQTVGEIVGALLALRDAGAVDQIVVVDAASADGTAAIAERAGAEVWQEGDLLPSYGPVLGKGDAMWRALSVLEGELVCFLDADTQAFSAHFAAGLLGPLVCESGVSFVKAFYRRPLVQGGVSLADGGGRVNHLTARPALELFYPQLAGVRQPLAGEVAARRDLLEALPFVTGYGVEIAMLIDVWRRVGLEGIAQVDLDEHRNRHQSLSDLTPMALAVLAAIARRLQREGRLGGIVEAPVERPPLSSLDIPRMVAVATQVDGGAGVDGATQVDGGTGVHGGAGVDGTPPVDDSSPAEAHTVLPPLGSGAARARRG